MAFAYVAAVLCAVCYGLASVLQSIGARRVEGSGAINAKSLARIATQLPYLIGLGLDGVAWLLSLLALARLPLFVVQAMVAGAIGFTVLFAALFQHLRPTPRQLAFILVLGIGLGGLALSGAPEEARRTPPAYSWGMWVGVIVLAIVGAFAAKKFHGDKAAAALGCLAGLAYGGTALCARALVAGVSVSALRDPLLWGLVAYGALGLVFFTAALQRGSVTIATAWLFTAETVIPSIIGLTILGDSARSGYAAVAAVAFVATIIAAVGLTLVSPPME